MKKGLRELFLKTRFKMKKSCGLFTNIAPLYSRPLWYELSSSEIIDYHFYSSKSGFSGIKTIDINESRFINENGKLNWLFLRNIGIGNILFYQIGLITECLRTDYDAYILYGEMHSISNWIAAIICKIRKKPLLFWGHGLYGDEGPFKKSIRLLYYKLADCHLVYGNRSRELMISSGFKQDRVSTVYNSLDYNTHRKLYEEKKNTELHNLKIKLFPHTSDIPVIIFIGRLTREKKILYLLRAINISRKKGNYYNCLIVGGGSEIDSLRQESEYLGIAQSVYFYGPCYDETINSELIMISECCVSPGNIGLTAIHSMSLGTPVITHRNMSNQGPEAEAVIEELTGLFFDEDNVESLSETIDNLIINKKKTTMERNCIGQIDKFWNPSKQAEIFDSTILRLVS
jgi:glycosyltransferase involved in cell wall biosynthesis